MQSEYKAIIDTIYKNFLSFCGVSLYFDSVLWSAIKKNNLIMSYFSSEICIGNIFLQSVACIFTFLSVFWGTDLKFD